MELVSTPDNPPPLGSVCSRVISRDGKVLRGMHARIPNSKGTVVILGGRGDYIERYFETMHDLIRRGYSVAALDVRGQGGSARLCRNRYRGHVRRFDDLDDDLHAFMTQVVLPDCPPPYFALGHSTGGHIVLRALAERTWFTRAVAVAPLIGILYGRWPLPVVRILVFLLTSLGLGWLFLPGQGRRPLGRADFAGNPLTQDQRRWNRDSSILEVKPDLGTGGPTFSWLRAAMKSTAKFARLGRSTSLNCPVLIVAAGAERVVDNEATRQFARRVPGVSLVFIPGALHEILAEKDVYRDQFFAAFDAFIESGGPT